MQQLFELTIDGETIDASRLECHFQSDPYPGDSIYMLIINDTDVITHARKEFGEDVDMKINEKESRKFLSFLGGMIQIKVGRKDPLQFWANTIDNLKLINGKLILRGICSHHVSLSCVP